MKEFKVIIQRDEDGFFMASVPGLPGCHTQAKTLEQLQKRLHEAIALCLEVAQTDSQYKNLIRGFSYEPTFVGVETVRV
ncbi:MAG: type II toxin-antitoxin system HicB family antitoxin [Candidatus Uhrbacteria bacterium]|nr:type II toxin-antitoxin system HicB family antitoxin [Candidatus Uhrbacteria bacterium]